MDGESGKDSFRNFTPISMMSPETQRYLSKHGISDVHQEVYTLSDNLSISDSTLSLTQLSYEDIPILIPQKESNTENILLQILKLTFEKIRKNNEIPTMDRIRELAIQETRTCPTIYPQQRPAIASAFNAVELDMFNQPNKIEITTDLLCQPGKISVLNINSLSINRKRAVSVYVQQLLQKFKMERTTRYPGVILVIDEAEQLFPKHTSKRDKDYVMRINSKALDIANRGRKRLYGQFIVSHLPEEVDKTVASSAATQISFRCPGSDAWVAKTFGRECVEETNQLSDGTCRIKVNISTKDQSPVNARVYIPDVATKWSRKRI